MRTMLAAAAVLAALVPAPPAQAAAGSVTVSVVGASTGRTAAGSCVATASPAVAIITLECNSDIAQSMIIGVGAAVSPPIAGRIICGYAFAVFPDGSTATGSDCLS